MSTPPRGYRNWPIAYGLAVTSGEPFGNISEQSHAIARKLHAAGHISLASITKVLLSSNGRLRALALLHEAGASHIAGPIISYCQIGCRIKVLWKLTESCTEGTPYDCIIQRVHPNGALSVRCLSDQELYDIHPDLDEIKFSDSGTAVILDTHGTKYEGHFTAAGLAHGAITVTQNTAQPSVPTIAIYAHGSLVRKKENSTDQV
tara:strand:+ start:477 stop:1088 length:612 start_codon:yes stop_codon:yes gene_type:complete